jgi:hypothetical protein
VNVTLCDGPQLVKVSVVSTAVTGPDGLTETTTGAPVSALHPSFPVSWIRHAIATLLPGATVTVADPSIWTLSAEAAVDALNAATSAATTNRLRRRRISSYAVDTTR